jgi:hypothetical protein
MRPARFGVFGYPLGGEGRERPLVANWILAMLGFLVPVLAVLPVVPLVGYLVRVIDATAGGEPAPAVGGDVRSLLRDGLVGVVVAVAYLAVPLAALLVTVYGAVTTVEGADLAFAEQLLLYGGSTAVILLFVTACFLVPAALAVSTGDRPVRAAFSPARLRPLAGHAAYFSRWMAGAVTFGMAVSLASVTLQITAAGPIVAALVTVYGAVVAAHLWGLGVRYARER